MNSREARDVALESLRPYREKAYAELLELVGANNHFETAGPSGVIYQIETSVFWDDKSGGPIRVLSAVDDGGIRALVPLTESFSKAPDGTFIDES